MSTFYAILGSLVLGAVGILMAAGDSLSPEMLFGLGALPLIAMAVGNGTVAAEEVKKWAPQFKRERNGGAPEPPGPPWLFWLKVSCDLVVKVFLLFWHLSILSGALGAFGSEFGSLAAVGPVFDAVGMGTWTIGTVLSLAMTFVFLGTSPAAWYIYETKYTGPEFWKTPSPDRLILGAIIGLYSSLIFLELVILGQNISAAAAVAENPGPWGPMIDEEDVPASPFVQVGMSVLMTMLGIVIGWLSSRIILEVENS